MAKRRKPSEILTGFSTAKAHAIKHATSQIIELLDTKDHTAHISSSVPLHQPLFKPSPSEVWIDEYTPFEPLSIKLRFRNCDTVVRRLKIETPRSPFYRVRPWDAGNKKDCAKSTPVDGKVAAGMEIVFVLEFLPHDVTDYSLDLVCCTERERFLLPVRVQGRFAALDLPDKLDFGICPVKMPTTRVLTVRNVGTRGASFVFKTSEHFRVTPSSTTLTQRAAVQIELSCIPPCLESGEGELEVSDSTGQTAVVRLTGRVIEVDLFLSQRLVESSATYLSLSSCKTVKICNESEYALEFSWKSFADASREEEERSYLLDELSRMETAEREKLQLQLGETDDVDSRCTHSPFDVRKALDTKYRYLRKASLDDSMQFVDACFSISPLSGRVWAHSEVDIVVCFKPDIARSYSCRAFLEIAGKAARLPLQLTGKGIGPKVEIVYNEHLDFGDIFINEERTRNFTIQNKGEISADFELISVTMPANMSITVSPDHGTLAVNTMLKIEVTFSSQELGEVLQPICFGLKGSDEQLKVRMKAQVIPPILRFNVDQVNFGAVSYSFSQSRSIKLVNTSNIALSYSICIPEEAKYKQKEFKVNPSDGKLGPYEEEQITIHFMSLNVKVYHYQLVVGVIGVGADLLAIPINAQCLVPELTVLERELDFGRCFLRYPHKQMLVLENKSSFLFGRFEIAEQDSYSRAIATYTASQLSGKVSPGEQVPIEISFLCEKVGSIRLSLTINVLGSTDVPLSVILSAAGSGPQVELDQSQINWGNCSCLVDHERILRMTNVSVIPAIFKTFTREACSKFQINRLEGVLMANESLDLVIVANMDDTVAYKDQLHILINDGDSLVVPLSISGTGTTIWSSSDFREIDFKYQLTSKVCEWSCTLENRGKRVQVLSWISQAAASDKRKISSTKTQGFSKKSRSEQRNPSNNNQCEGINGEDRAKPVFSIFPNTIELKPRTACVFVFKGLSSSAGLIEEKLTCETRVGNDKVSTVSFLTLIRAKFVNPRLIFSSSFLSFEYIHHPGSQIKTLSRSLCLTNDCELPLSFKLHTQMPFALDCWEALLQPGEKLDLNVVFHPGFKDDHICRVINGKVIVVYTDHPQKDSVDLIGDINFPNLSFETTNIDFGCTLNDTQKSIYMNVTNVSRVDTSYRWIFVENEKDVSSIKPYIPINQVFDILPICGRLRPNESEKIEFVYFGHADRKFRSIVACEIEGGPEYELMLSGEASSIAYELDRNFLNFGQVFYSKTHSRDFHILNVGKVPFSFKLIVNETARRRTCEFFPTTGTIASNERQRIIVRLRPGIPEFFDENIVIKLAHFQPFPFKLFGCGTFAAVTLNLPRENDQVNAMYDGFATWKELQLRARLDLEQKLLKPARTANTNRQLLDESAILIQSDLQLTKSSARADNGLALSRTKISHQRGEVSGSPACSITTPEADDLDVEFEACRLFFSNFIIAQEMAKANMTSIEPKDVNLKEAEEIKTGSRRSTNSPRPPSSRSNIKAKAKRELEELSFVLSQFVLDYGNVVVGAHNIKRFNVTNIGHGPASFQIDQDLAKANGIQIEPERVVQLPPKQSIELSVKFSASKSIALGKFEAQLSILVKNGPPCTVVVRAVVTVPEIEISTEHLEFGKIAVGMCRTIYTQMQNVSHVPAEWVFKKPMGSMKDVKNFDITPRRGLLPPGSKMNIKIDFIPDKERHFYLRLPIKVSSDTKTRSIVCRGEGSELRISFHPPLVEFGPVLPCSPPEERHVEICNDSDYAVEVFSLDFDSAYQHDEAQLQSLNAFTSEKTLRLPVRVPGTSLAEYVADNILIPAHISDVGQSDADPAKLRGTNDLTSKENSDFGETILSSNGFADFHIIPRKGIDYIVVGPSQCGRSTQACLLAEKESLVVWTIDGAIQSVCVAKGPLADAMREALGVSPVAIDPMHIEMPKLADDFAQGETSRQTTSERLAYLLHHVILWRMAQPDMKKGSVLDSFENSFLSFQETLQCYFKPLLAVRVIVLSFDEDTYESLCALTTSQKFIADSTASNAPLTSNNDLTLKSSLLNDANGVTEKLNAQNAEKSGCNEDNTIKTEDQKHLELASSQKVTQDLVTKSGEPVEAEFYNSFESTRPVQKVIWDSASPQAANISKPATFLEYSLILQDMKCQLASLIMHDKAAFGQPQGEDIQAEDLWAKASEVFTLDNYVLEISIKKAGPPHILHSLIMSAIENFTQNWKCSRLPIPTTTTVQLVQSPPERLPRKSVAKFSLRSANTVSSHKLEVNSDIYQEAAEANGPNKYLTRSELNEQDLVVTTTDANPQTERCIVQSSCVNSIGIRAASEVLSSESRSCSPSISRWIIAPHSSVDVLVLFASTDVGIFDCSLGFEIVGSQHEFNLLCRGICGVPTINNEPRNVFMHRVKTRSDDHFVRKKFVTSRNQFEFGPLVVNNQCAEPPQTQQDFIEWQKTSPNNVEVFRISNSSQYPIYVELVLKLEHDNTFAVFPRALELKENDTSNVMVWANPSKNGLQENSLICCIRDNPEPVEFRINCYGCIPELKLHGPWEQSVATITAEEKTQTRDLRKKNVSTLDRPIQRNIGMPPVKKPSMAIFSPQQPILNFNKLLPNRKNKKTFYIENVTPIDVLWRLSSDNLPTEFQISPTEGTLNPLQKVPVLVVLSAKEETIYDHSLQIVCSDVSTALQVSDQNQMVTLILRGEAQRIQVDSFDNKGNEIFNQETTEFANTANGDGSLKLEMV
ncbi:putative immunoglobulin-like, hydrocephalus-inducing [Plasmopara halstedii]